MSDLNPTFQSKTLTGRSQKLAGFLSRRWFWIFVVLYGLFVGIPFLAPVFMRLRWDFLAKAIYNIYSLLCHQLPERSIFLFGPKAMYSLGEIQAAWQSTLDPLVLRQFIGNSAMGWKVAWSDRMVSMYTGVLFFALLWWPLRKRLQPLPWWGLFVLLLPMAVDGTSHLISDLWGSSRGSASKTCGW
jgi:uncharacterized membrane protein